MSTEVWIACPGLGRVKRGTEAFAEECFEALAGEPALEFTLLRGAGASGAREHAVSSLSRNGRVASWLHQKLRGWPDVYYEQGSFFLGLLPRLATRPPALIYFAEDLLGNLLWSWRRWTGSRFRLLFLNGGPSYPPFTRPLFDHVQQLAPIHLERSVAAGLPAEAQTMLTLGHSIEPELSPVSREEREGLRRRLGLPLGRPILLAVSAINSWHKRVDYLIEEIASLPEPRPFLLVLGQRERGSEPILSLGRERLARGFEARTAEKGEMSSYYRAADLLAHAALRECLGRGLVEASSWGLACVTHDSPAARFVLGSHGVFGDLARPGALARAVSTAIAARYSPQAALARHRHAFERFSWSRLRPQYVRLFESVARGPGA